eukprot:225876-Pelagomonas_calceolata.AAC.1
MLHRVQQEQHRKLGRGHRRAALDTKHPQRIAGREEPQPEQNWKVRTSSPEALLDPCQEERLKNLCGKHKGSPTGARW